MDLTQKPKNIFNVFMEDPKKRLEWLLVLSALFIGYIYIYIYQNMLRIKVELIDFKTLIQMPIMAMLIIPLIHNLIIKSDPLQRSRRPKRSKSVKFFQNEFPSTYILKRCERCVENENSCPNYIIGKSYTHVKYWYNDVFHGILEQENPKVVKDTFAKGYTCKLVYYLSWILAVFSILGIGIIMFHHFYLYLFNKLRVDITSTQILFPLVCISILILMKKLHSPDENAPSGCWQAWQEINRIHVSWLRNHESFLVKLICQANGITKSFKEK